MEMKHQVPFRVLRGGYSETAFDSSKDFIDAYITDTRLMGVTCLRIRWNLPENSLKTTYYQFFYFDAEEFGLETYESVLCAADMEESFLLSDTEARLAGGLGGKKNAVTEREARFLVQSYVDFHLARRLPLPENSTEFDFLLSPRIALSDEEYHALLRKQCPVINSAYQVINYFLMRCIGRDFPAAKLLTKNYVRTDLFSNFPPAALMKNTIREDRDAKSGSNTDYYATDEDKDFGTFQTRKSYICESLIEFNETYFLLLTRVTLDHLKVVKYERLSCFGVSAWEASLMLAAPEYVSVYDIEIYTPDITRHTASLLGNAMVNEHENGRLFMIFYPDNDHVKKREYRLNDDVFGMCFVSEGGQLILVSNMRQNVSAMEGDFKNSDIFPALVPAARYAFNNSVFKNFIHSNIENFEDFVQIISMHEED